jgi:hypothetical protein
MYERPHERQSNISKVGHIPNGSTTASSASRHVECLWQSTKSHPGHTKVQIVLEGSAIEIGPVRGNQESSRLAFGFCLPLCRAIMQLWRASKVARVESEESA